MTKKLSNFSVFLIGFSLFLLIHPSKAISADFSFGYSYGYSHAVTEKQYDVYIWNGETGDKEFTIPHLKTCQILYAHIFFKNSKFGLGFEGLKQKYTKIHKYTYYGAEQTEYRNPADFVYFIFSVNYRFFAAFF